MADEHKTELTGKASIQAGTHIDGQLQMTPSQKAAAGPQPEPKTVTMDVLRDGSFNGQSHHAGDSVDVPEQYVEALTLSGFAARSDRNELAQQARDAKAKDAADSEAKAAGRGKPLMTTDIPGGKLPKSKE